MARARRHGPSANPVTTWLKLGADVSSLGVQASAVIGLRMLTIAGGGAAANAEVRLMINEKVKAALEMQTLALTGRLGGRPDQALAKTLAHYGRKVNANRRRLAKT